MAKRLSPAQCKAIEVLLDSPTVPDAARVLGISVKKLYRWLANPVFAAEYEAATREAHNHRNPYHAGGGSRRIGGRLSLVDLTARIALCRERAMVRMVPGGPPYLLGNWA